MLNLPETSFIGLYIPTFTSTIISLPLNVQVCESCIGEKESCELMHKLNYRNEDICVILVRGKEVPKSILEASKGLVETDRRISKRSRKTKNGSSVSLKVSASTSLYQLKMMIWESFGVSKLYVVCICFRSIKCCTNKHTLKMAK